MTDCKVERFVRANPVSVCVTITTMGVFLSIVYQVNIVIELS